MNNGPYPNFTSEAALRRFLGKKSENIKQIYRRTPMPKGDLGTPFPKTPLNEEEDLWFFDDFKMNKS